MATETRPCLASRPAEARVLRQAGRGHQGVDNPRPEGLDMAFHEDESRIRTGHADHNLSIRRRRAPACCAARPWSRGPSRPSASRPVGTTGTCSRADQMGMRLPYAQGPAVTGTVRASADLPGEGLLRDARHERLAIIPNRRQRRALRAATSIGPDRLFGILNLVLLSPATT